jgi:lipoate-protein ligase A
MTQLLLPGIAPERLREWVAELVGPAGEEPTIDDVAEALAAAIEDELGFAVRIEKPTEAARMCAAAVAKATRKEGT